MIFNSSPADKAKQEDFHALEYVKTQLKVKNTMPADLIKAIDELTEVTSSNAERIEHLKGALPNCKTEAERQQTITENTNFYGPHYVECYVVKNGVCVARDRISVPIGND